MQMQERAYKAEDVVRFLKMLLHKISGKLLIIWDGSPIHRADVVKQFLSSPMGTRVHLERLPGYAPELNPQKSRPPAILAGFTTRVVRCHIYLRRIASQHGNEPAELSNLEVS